MNENQMTHLNKNKIIYKLTKLKQTKYINIYLK